MTTAPAYFLCVDGREIASLGIGFAKKTGNAWVFEDFTVEKASPEDFLQKIECAIANTNHHIDGIIVCAGPGSATALRSSLGILNTIAFTRSIPLYSLVSQEKNAKAALHSALNDLPQPTPYCEPIYLHEPRITTTKKDALRRTV